MCGRYSLAQPDKIAWERWRIAPPGLPPRYNIAPTQYAAVILQDERGPRLHFLRWGLIPSWAKDISIGSNLINARAETLAQKATYRGCLVRRRCLVLADGFYEWKTAGQAKIPHRFILRSGRPFAFAGLWDHWQGVDGTELETFAIITTSANELCRAVHDRMPAILPEPAWEKWIDCAGVDPSEARASLAPYPAAEMTRYAVSRTVNNARNDVPECIERSQPELDLDLG